MKAVQFDTFQVPRAKIGSSLLGSVLAIAGVLVILQSAIPSAALAASGLKPRVSFEDDIQFVDLIVPPKYLHVELPNGKTEITKTFKLVGPDQIDRDYLNREILACAGPDASYEERLASCGWVDEQLDAGTLEWGFLKLLTIKSKNGRRMEFTMELRPNPPPAAAVNVSPWRMKVASLDQYDLMYLEERAEARRDGFSTTTKFPYPAVTRYQDFTVSDDETFLTLILLPDVWDSQRWPMELVVTVRALPDVCLMSVRFTGDIEGVDFGNIAFYNDFMKEGSPYKEQGGVARASGTGADPSALATLDVLMEMTGVYNPEAEMTSTTEDVSGVVFDPFSPESLSEDLPTSPPVDLPESERRAAFNDFTKWVGGADDVGEHQLEQVGLTLVARKQRKGSDNLSAGLEQLGNTAVLELGMGQRQCMEKREDPGSLNMESYDCGAGSIIKRLEFSPGALSGRGPSAAKFVWHYDEQGFADIYITQHPDEGDGRFSGHIRAELYADNHRQPDGRKSKIFLEAKFLAEETYLGCEFKGNK